MRHQLGIDNSATVDIMQVPVKGKYSIKLTASDLLEFDYAVRIWNDNTKQKEITSNPIVLIKNEKVLKWEIDCEAIGLEVGQYHYELIETSDTGNEKRIIKGFLNVVN